MNLIEQFRRAAEAGLTAEQTQAFIADNNLAEKSHSRLLKTRTRPALWEAANVEKSAEALAYAEGFITKASEAGLPIEQACVVTKQALAHSFPTEFVHSGLRRLHLRRPKPILKSVAYFTGLFEKAAELGFSESQTSEFLQKAAGHGRWFSPPVLLD
jgi:hypothetical protein